MRAYSRFPQPDLHRLDTRPYGLQAEDAEKEIRTPIFRLCDLGELGELCEFASSAVEFLEVGFEIEDAL